MFGIDESLPFKPLQIAVLTISDTRPIEEDRSGALLIEMLRADGHILGSRALVRDEIGEIQSQIEAWLAEPSINVIITTGGTGLTGRDITPEAVRPLLEKEIDGFSVMMHLVSYQTVGTSTVQSRALGGVSRGKYIFCLPGSSGGCRDAWTKILHYQLDSRHRPCNFVEIMPRLTER